MTNSCSNYSQSSNIKKISNLRTIISIQQILSIQCELNNKHLNMNKFQNTKFQDLEIIETVAETHGGNTKIYLCRFQGQLQVCKAILKSTIVCDAKAVQHVKNQKQALKYFTQIKFPHICSLNGTFQDENNIYFMMEMVQGLPLHKITKMVGPLNARATKIICIQVAEILRLFHQQGYIYRDIKSSNFMMNTKGKIKMIDLGKAKLIKKQRAYTICGTTHAMPPDIYLKNGYSYEFDYYSFGILIYQLLIGSAPFGYGSNKQILNEIQKGLTKEHLQKIKDEQAYDLISRLIVKQPRNRLGYEGGFEQILKHKFFESDLLYSLDILNGEDQLSPYQQQFSEILSDIEDLGIDPDRYNQVTEDDPFYKFL